MFQFRRILTASSLHPPASPLHPLAGLVAAGLTASALVCFGLPWAALGCFRPPYNGFECWNLQVGWDGWDWDGPSLYASLLRALLYGANNKAPSVLRIFCNFSELRITEQIDPTAVFATNKAFHSPVGHLGPCKHHMHEPVVVVPMM